MCVDTRCVSPPKRDVYNIIIIITCSLAATADRVNKRIRPCDVTRRFSARHRAVPPTPTRSLAGARGIATKNYIPTRVPTIQNRCYYRLRPMTTFILPRNKTIHLLPPIILLLLCYNTPIQNRYIGVIIPLNFNECETSL